ncbi:CidA/LrgA family protein [Domibacillus indicus]|uniref:CidA/LrgA family protein n=1 Tax=Domibacillus indicus TaxID=1437523 RepID=UPI0006180E44|nr:CidA/LrgA family protein [Domibacillus indicus]
MKNAAFFIAQLLFLTALYQLSARAVSFLHIPIPASVFGMVTLLLLLLSGAVPDRFIRSGAGFLNKHLGFFFIPIAVGLMAYGELIRSDGLVLFFMIAGSSVIGLFITAGLSHFLTVKRKPKQ